MKEAGSMYCIRGGGFCHSWEMKGIDMQNGVEEGQDEGQLFLEGDTCFLCRA